ncbi:MAG: mechanosensitive ion channel, partial [Okeania sp. SIO2D1]|nr:mechanosensitive ion channel [Okeania sp. SIO2D1]
MEIITDYLVEIINKHQLLPLVVLGLAGLFLLVIGVCLLRKIYQQITSLLSPQLQEVYEQIFEPYQQWFSLVIILTTIDLVILITSTPHWLESIEILISLIISTSIVWLGSRFFQKFFDMYLLDAAIQSKRKVNSEILILAKILANAAIIVLVILLFAQTHHINIFGLIASLGVGGLAVAFAAQKTLEQLLGGIVLYIDSPFVTDDYIGLPDGSFGRVESIGLRSTKIRT